MQKPQILQNLVSKMWKENLFLLAIFIYAEAANFAKFFKYTQTLNGTAMCALDQPSLVIPFDQLFPLPSGSCSPVGVRCAYQCALDPDCTNFNHKTDKRKCELFYYTPKNCSALPNR